MTGKYMGPGEVNIAQIGRVSMHLFEILCLLLIYLKTLEGLWSFQ